MKLWPWAKPEMRAGYSDAYVDAVLAAASGDGAAAVAETAAAELAAGLFERAFASAKVMPDNPAITPQYLAEAGRALVLRGEHVSMIDMVDGRVMLRSASRHEVRGVRALTYRLTIDGPDGEFVRVVPADGVVHLRFSTDPGRPWRGIGPLARAGLSSRTAAALELRLGQESNARVGYLLPVPVDGQDEKVEHLRRDLAQLKGQAALVETTSAGWDQGRSQAPQRDMVPSRVGANPPAALVQLRQQSFDHVLAACGVPLPLSNAAADGLTVIRAYSRFTINTVEPIAKVVAGELSDKLAASVEFSFPSYRRNPESQSRIINTLTSSGVPLPEALALAEMET